MESLDTKKRDIILFMMDQLAAKWLEAALEGTCPLKNVDRLRSKGVTFTNTITSNPVCCPARATISTGQTTRGHGVLENAYKLNEDLPTFMKVLQQNGWRTGAFGKVHHHPHFAGLYPDYKPYGFDVTHITEDPRGGEWLDWVKKEHPNHYESALATVWASSLPEYEKYGPQKVNLKLQIEKIRSKFQWTTSEFPNNTPHRYTLPFPEYVSQTNWITQHALNFIQETKPNTPFFALISYIQPHAPSCPPAKYMEYVDTEKIQEPLPPVWENDPHVTLHRHKPIHTMDPKSVDWKYARHTYFADIAHLDHQLGRVIEILEKTGRIKNTYLIFLSDHGDLLFDHGFCNKEERHYDACIRVPLIISGPNLQKGLVNDDLVQLEDICPTILDMTSLSFPRMPKMGSYLSISQENIPNLVGESLLPTCKGQKPNNWRTKAYCESYNYIGSNDPGDWARTIITERFRYTIYPKGNGEQLFDLIEDPDEQHSLIGNPKYKNIRRELRDELIEQIILQDFPKTRNNLFALGVH